MSPARLPFAFAIAIALPLSSAACTNEVSDPDADLELAAGDVDPGPKADGVPSWDLAPTLHLGEVIFDHAAENGRSVHSLWVAGSDETPVPVEITVQSEDEGNVRVALLGPLVNGSRQVIGASGYAESMRTATVSAQLTRTGQHLVVIGSRFLDREVFYSAVVRCAPDAGEACSPERVDLVSEPKVGALVGEELGADWLLRTQLGLALEGRSFDVELELWASPPAQHWNAELVAVAVAGGNQINSLVPASVVPGDDLLLVLREAGGAVLDTGVRTRFAPAAQLVRLDSILYGDLVAVTISGVTGYTEGVAELALRSVTHKREIDRVSLRAELPGQVGNGFGAFDVTFAPDIVGDDGELNPRLPRNGEVLSVGWIDGNNGYNRLGCFEYCNDLTGEETCTSRPRACAVPGP
jgi:hypothetical protein